MARIFDKPSHKQFSITPRYWNPEKEERDEREKRIKAELGIKDDDNSYIPNVKGRFTSVVNERYSAAKSARNKSIVRIFFILIILLIIAYYLVFKYANIF